MSKVNKIKDEELQKIVEKTKEQNELLRTIGVLETQKQGVLVQLANSNKDLEEIKKELEDEYGASEIILRWPDSGCYLRESLSDDQSRHWRDHLQRPGSIWKGLGAGH